MLILLCTEIFIARILVLIGRISVCTSIGRKQVCIERPNEICGMWWLTERDDLLAMAALDEVLSSMRTIAISD